MTPDGNNAPALFCKGLVKKYPDVVAVNGLNLSVRHGECFGLLGPNGAGKTTTVEILEGLTDQDGGEVEILGCSWKGRDECNLRERLGIQLQETLFPEKLTVEEILRLFRSFYKSGLEVDEALAMVELGEKRKARFEKLSGGQKQRLALACALVGNPEVLFLDEPTTGLDPQARHKVWELIEALRAREVTVLITTHYMEEAARLCDRVAVMDRGKIIAQGPPAELVAGLGASQVLEFRVEGLIDDSALAGLPGVTGVSRRETMIMISVSDVTLTLPALLAEIEQRGIKLESLATHQATLEDVFIKLTGRVLRDG